MTLLYIIFLIWVLFLLVDFKKAVLIYAPFKILFYYDVRLTASLPFDMAMMLLFAGMYFLNRKRFNSVSFPFSRGFVVYAIIVSFGCIYPVFAINKIPAIVIGVLFYSYIYIKCLETVKDVKLAIFSHFIFAIFLVSNGVLEYQLGSCPVDEWIRSMPYIDKEHAFETNFDVLRFGLPRLRSFMPFSISYGVCCVIFFAIPFYLLFFNTINSISKTFIIICGMMLLLGIICSGSRSPIIGLIIIFGYLLLDRNLLISYKKQIFILGIFIFMFLWPYIYQNIMSIIDPSAAQEASGSSTEMRIGQYAIAFEYVNAKPLFGWGQGLEVERDGFYGGESIWLPLMMKGGLLGVFGYIYLYYDLYVNTNSNNRKYLITISCSWLAMNTATSLMGIGDATFFTIYFLLYRLSKVSKT